MDRIIQGLTVLLLSGLCSGQAFGNEDPCETSKHRVQNETTRSIGYSTRPTDTPACDNRLRRGWYVFTGLSAEAVEMPTACPGINTCGTTTPLWIDGKIPTVRDGIVTRRLCGRLPTDDPAGDCCGYEDEVFVKKCTDFIVYYLNPTTDCPAGYCAGTAKRCPENKWSSNNFEPCKDLAPVLETPPTVKGPNINARQSFDFKCEITYGPNDPDQVFSVLWTFNNQPDPAIPAEVLTGKQRVATLSGDKLTNHVDQEVRCQVTSYYTPRSERNMYTSSPNYVGVKEAKLTGPNKQGTTKFNFKCEVVFGSQDPNQRIEVIWTFDGQQDPKIASQIITGKSRIATLDGRSLKGHINSNVGCQARLLYDGLGIKTQFVKSNTYFAGIQISTSNLEISDSDGEKDITVTSTIPVMCDQGPVCCLTFKLAVDNTAVVSLKSSCDYTICSNDWDDKKKQASFIVTVVPSRNSIGGVSRQAVLTFTELAVSGTGQYIGLFNDVKLNPVQIVVKLETGFKCSMVGDPHFALFDFEQAVHLYQTGDYTVYTVKDRDFTVQIRTWRCWAVTCVCGVVVKEKNDIIRVHGCDKPGLLASTIDVPYQLSVGTTVQRASNGQLVAIKLPSGSEIKIEINDIYMNVYIQTPSYDRAKAFGVCGTNDGIRENDFTHPDGTVTPICTGPAACIPVDFTESWRVDGASSMFVVTPAQVPEVPPTEYCSCRINAAGKSEYSCSPRQHIQDTNLACPNCPAITDTLTPTLWGQPDSDEKPYVHVPVKAVDPNQKWPNAQGVTENEAKKLCDQALQKSPLYPRCKDVKTVVDNSMRDCLGDVLHGGTTEALNAVTSSFTSRCQIKLSEDEKNYKLGPDGTLTLNPEISTDVCPTECLTHGKCGQKGKCECQTGWEGDTCQIEAGKGPQITCTSGPRPNDTGDDKKPVKQTCYAGKATCGSIQFDKYNVNIYTPLKCRVQPLDGQDKKTGQAVIVNAAKGPSSRVTCPLPNPGETVQKYLVSVTADGVTYGNEIYAQAPGCTCLDCDGSTCKVKKTVCYIHSVCYKNGETNKNNKLQVCDASKSSTSWTKQTAPSTDSSTTNTSTDSGTKTDNNDSNTTNPKPTAGTKPDNTTPTGNSGLDMAAVLKDALALMEQMKAMIALLTKLTSGR